MQLPGGSVRGERANFTKLVISCIEAKFFRTSEVSQILQENTRWKALGEIYTMHSFASFWNPLHRFEIESQKPGKPWGDAPVLESTCENWGKKGLAKTTPKRKKTRKREAIKQRAASHLELR